MSQRSLGQHALSGVQWAMGGRVVKSGMSIVTLAVVSRHMTPAEFGVVALVMFVAAFAQLFVDAGLRVALVQRKEINELQRNTVFWSALVLSLILAALILGFAGLIARGFGAEGMETPLRWITLLLPISAFQMIPLTTLERAFDFSKIAIGEALAALCGSVVAIILVIQGFGVMALVIQQIVQTITTVAIFNIMARWRPALAFSWTEFCSLASYGLYMMMTNFAVFMSSQFDRPIIVGVLSPAVLGYVSVANQIITSPFRIIAQTVRRVLFPILSSVQDDLPRIGAAYLRVQFAMALVMAPACLGVAAIAPWLVDVLLGEGWKPVTPLIQILALQRMLLPVQKVNETVLSSVGRVRFQFYWSLGGVTISLLALYFGAVWGGIEAALWARLAVTGCTVPILSLYVMHILRLNWISLPKVLAAPFFAAIIMFFVVNSGGYLLDVPAWTTMLLFIPAGALFYGAVMFCVARQPSVELVKMVLKRGQKVS